MKLSIVATLYRSDRDLAEFHRRAMAAAGEITRDIEMILVDDGSPDESLLIALDLQTSDPRITVVELARNFGHHRAMMTGLAQATGDFVFLVDSDLEEPPELLAEFHRKMLAEDWDVVYGVQRDRRGGLMQRIAGEGFFRLTELLSDHPLPRNVITARLMRHDYVRALVAHEDRSFLIAHLWNITGFRQSAMEVEKLSLSPTTYSLRKRIEMGVQHVTTTSTKVLYLIFYTGLGISILSVAVILFFLIVYASNGRGVDGWTSLILSLWFFGGLIIQILGLLGLYIANIYQEVKRRPYTQVRRLHRRSIEGPHDG